MTRTLLRHSFLQIWDNVLVLFSGNFALITISLLVALSVELSLREGPVLFFTAATLGVAAITWSMMIYAAFLDHHLNRSTSPFDWTETSKKLLQTALMAGSTVLAISALAVRMMQLTAFVPDIFAWLVLALTAWVAMLAFEITVLCALLVTMGKAPKRALESAVVLALARPGTAALFLAAALLLMASTLILLPGPGGAILLLRNLLQFHLRAEEGPSGTPWEELVARELAVQQRLDARSLLFPWRR